MSDDLTTPMNEIVNEAAPPVQVVNEAAPPVQVVNEAAPPAAETLEYTLPEGAPDFFKQFAKDNKLSQDQLNATLGVLQNGLQATRQQELDALQSVGKAHVETWGDKAGFNMSVAKRALKQSDPEGKLTTMLRETGYAHHPVVLEFFKDLGLNLQEGGFLKGAVNVPPGERSLAQVMYGDSHPSKQ